MSPDDDIATQAVKSLLTGPVATELYKDLLQPAANELGQNLLVVARAVSLALAPLSGAVWGFEQIRDWVAVKITEKLAHTPIGEIHAPKMSIAGPAVLALQFSKDEAELKELYANLLASSMDGRISPRVHPSFVQLIEQMSADEARLLSWVAHNVKKLDICKETFSEVSYPSREKEPSIAETFRQMAVAAKLDQIDDVDSYADNLMRLKIFEQTRYSEAKYESAEERRYADYEARVLNEDTIVVEVTSFGQKFINCCVLAPGDPPWPPRS
jgi:hypothetical protein